MHKVLAGEIPSYQMEKRYFHKNGRLVFINLSVSIVRDQNGGPMYFVSQVENITERKLREAERGKTHLRVATGTDRGQGPVRPHPDLRLVQKCPFRRRLLA